MRTGLWHRTLLYVLAVSEALLTFASGANGQQPANQTIAWGSGLRPVVLGQGLEIRPGEISVLNTGVDGSKYYWQKDSTQFTLLDYSDTNSTISNLHLNAWAEYDGFTANAKFSFNYNNYQAYTGNTRHWEVDADRLWTATIPSPNLTATAIKYQTAPATFEALYGNYAVTSIAFRRHIKIRFDVVFTSTVSSTDWNAAVSGSYGVFSAGADVSSEQASLDACGKTSISIEVDGDKGGTIIASGGSGDLPTLRDKLLSQLATWDNPPPAADANDAGIVDTVYLTTYNAVTPPVGVTRQQSPDQIILTNALTNLLDLLQAQQRMKDIKRQEFSNLNPKIKAYLFGSTDPQTKAHIPGKFDEVNADVPVQLAYYKSLHNHDGRVSDPKITFTWDDPDAIKWRILNATYSNVVGATAGVLFLEIYSNSNLIDPINITAQDANRWGTRWFTSTMTVKSGSGVVEIVNAGPEITDAVSYTSHLDPVTGIPHRFAYIEWEAWGTPTAPGDQWLGLLQNGQQIYTALDFDGNPAPLLFAPAGSFHM